MIILLQTIDVESGEGRFLLACRHEQIDDTNGVYQKSLFYIGQTMQWPKR
jgi:hypothetical protein